jgi:hypothetical protein
MGVTKTSSPTNLNRSKNGNFGGTTGEEDIDFDGLTNPSVHKFSQNELGGFAETAYGTAKSQKKVTPQ